MPISYRSMHTSRILSASTLGRALAEIAIIVTGVLIALGADAWWTERQERRDYQTAVAGLLGDVDGNLAHTDQVRAELSEMFDLRTRALETLIDPGVTTPDTVVLAVVSFFNNPEFALLEGGLEAVRTTDIWSRLPNSARTGITLLPSRAAAPPDERAALEEATIRLLALMGEYGGFPGLEGQESERNALRMARDERFLHYAYVQALLVRNSLDRLDTVVAELEALRSILEAELE